MRLSIYRRAILANSILSVFLLAATITSAWIWVFYYGASKVVSISSGCIHVFRKHPGDQTSGIMWIIRPPRQVYMGPYFQLIPIITNRQITIPIWLPIGLSLFCLRALWLSKMKTNVSAGCDECKECGYSLIGNVSGACPECGTERGNRDSSKPA